MPERSAIQRWGGLALWIALSFLPATTAIFVDTGPWYSNLNRPAWTPPSWMFGPVWTLLYLMMGVAAWRVWLKHGFTHARAALLIYLVHLAFNAAWTVIFFGMHMITLAAVEIVVLWLMIAALIVMFSQRDRIAAGLLVPYVLWVTYATTLNVGFAVMN